MGLLSWNVSTWLSEFTLYLLQLEAECASLQDQVTMLKDKLQQAVDEKEALGQSLQLSKLQQQPQCKGTVQRQEEVRSGRSS
jgi:hypothetical protein